MTTITINCEIVQQALDALDAWLNTYAEEFCDPARVAQAKERIAEHGGTLAYIAEITQALRVASNPDKMIELGWEPKEIVAKKDAALRSCIRILKEWDALIRYQYSGTRQAMSDMTRVAQGTPGIIVQAQEALK